MTELLDNSFTIVILAAGSGTRMGDIARSKLLLPWRDGKTILWHAARNATKMGAREVVVVVRPDLPEMVEALRDLPARCVPNSRYAEGMGTSLAVGIGAVADEARAALLLLGDEPDISPTLIARLIRAYRRRGKPITIAKYGEQPGPPAIFARSIFHELTELQGDAGARQIVAAHPDWVCFVPFSETEMPHDIDTPEDFARS